MYGLGFAFAPANLQVTAGYSLLHAVRLGQVLFLRGTPMKSHFSAPGSGVQLPHRPGFHTRRIGAKAVWIGIPTYLLRRDSFSGESASPGKSVFEPFGACLRFSLYSIGFEKSV